MKIGTRPHKLNPVQVADILSYVEAHHWRGAMTAICRKYKISDKTLAAIRKGVYYANGYKEKVND
jgi:hypothetical protein